MKKLLGVFLVVLFALSIYFSVNKPLNLSASESHTFASGSPVPTPVMPVNRGN